MQNQEWHSLRMQLNASDNCPSLATHAFSKRTRLNRCFKQMFGRVIELLINSIFQYHILLTLIFYEKNGTRETSPDNQKVQITELRIIEVRLY